MTCRRKRRFEFQDFSDILCKPIPDMCCPNSELEVHLTLDNCIIRYGLDKRLDRNTNA
jgi:hypothetical protein